MILEKRRLLADVNFLFMALNGYIKISVHSYIDFYSEIDQFSLRHKDNLTLKKKYAKTNVLKYSLFHRIYDSWNLLPREICNTAELKIFKTRAKKFLLELWVLWSDYFCLSCFLDVTCLSDRDTSNISFIG